MHALNQKISSKYRPKRLREDSFFLGLIFGLIFILAATLIIYYKQVSEGIEDKERFEILQKVGLSHKEVKQSDPTTSIDDFFFSIGSCDHPPCIRVSDDSQAAFAFRVDRPQSADQCDCCISCSFRSHLSVGISYHSKSLLPTC